MYAINILISLHTEIINIPLLFSEKKRNKTENVVNKKIQNILLILVYDRVKENVIHMFGVIIWVMFSI